ncbi:glycosyltransferase family 1 protein [Arenibacter sp. TNZ]|uniref:glycosyltransferase family 4 protein n=1 Tax=Arenibacter TaxID=178469 RepID=UPI000CD482B6|nr:MULTISPECIES: glycosyltransferase family 4 protein [Arenibacter]MCM4172561.1 glycosyltransferase family 1 protein [Arenibacter sp. TNZ]
MQKKLIRITTVSGSLDGLLQNQLKFMSDHFEVIGMSSKGIRLDKVRKEQNVRVIPLQMSRSISPLKDVVALIKLYTILRKEKPFILHSHTPKAGLLGMMASYFAKVPHRLHTVAGLPLLETKGIKRIILNFAEKATYAFATRVYPNSFGLEKIILDHNFTNKNKLKVIGNGSSNGIDLAHFDPSLFSEEENGALRQQLNIGESDFVFINIGRMVKDKGINELVEAFCKIQDTHKSVKLLLLGEFEKDLDPLLPETMDHIKNNPNIIYLGWQWDVRPYFAISNMLAFPSYREGFPNVVMQAGAMGLPSIVSDINGCNEIIVNGENGCIVPPKSMDDLYVAMIETINNGTSKFKNARNSIAVRFDRSVIWNAILAEYDSLTPNPEK